MLFTNLAILNYSKNAKFYHLKSIILNNLSEYEKSVESINKAIELDPKNKFYKHTKNISLKNRKLYDEKKILKQKLDQINSK